MTTLEEGLAVALRSFRLAKGLKQEDFKGAVSEGYISRIERGIYSPSLSTICQIAQVMDIHPLSLLTVAFEVAGDGEREGLMERMVSELAIVGRGSLATRPGRRRPLTK